MSGPPIAEEPPVTSSDTALAVLHRPSNAAAARHLVLAHGFTQNNRCWGPFAKRLGESHSLSLVDLPGHGQSGHDTAGLVEAGALLTAAGPGVYIGYSMGGRVALHGALAPTSPIQALVLIGATAGIADRVDRAERRTRDELLADTVEHDGTKVFIDQWLRTPLFAALTPEQQHRDARLMNRSAGLAASLRHCGTGTQMPLHHRLSAISVPVLCVVGELDAKFRAESELLTAAIGDNATSVVVAGAGHACHLEAPDATATVVLDWLSETLLAPR